MYRFSQDGVTIASMLDTRKANKDEKFPVKIRVTFKRDRKYYSTGKDLTAKEWEKLPDTKSRSASELKVAIQQSFEIVRSTALSLITEGNFTFDLLSTRLGRGLGGSVNTAMKVKADSLLLDDKIATSSWYHSALTSITKFAGENIAFSSITPEWLTKYEKWMLSKKLSYNTISMYVRALRVVINEAKEGGIIRPASYPFGPGKYVIPSAEGRKLALTLAQIKQLITYTDGLTRTEQFRDLWVLSYLLNGINIGDLISLKYENIVGSEIRFYRSKTVGRSRNKKEIRAVYTDMAKSLIERWGSPGRQPNEYIFPYLNGSETAKQRKLIIRGVVTSINLRLEAIGKHIGVARITTYSARHSFATVLKRSGANTSFISEALGHKDLKTTENYLDQFESEERKKNADMLTNF